MSAAKFALFGATPTFPHAIPFGQRYFPSWERYREAFQGIFERQYYTEYGPLNQQLEKQLQEFLGVKHAICVTNETVGMMMVASALCLTSKVILPALASDSAVASLRWAGLEPVFCPVNPDTLQIDVKQIEKLIGNDVSAIMGMHAYGGACDVDALEQMAEARGLRLYFDASHAFGCAANGKYVGNFGTAEIFSFHQDNILNATEGGCICTNDDELAARLRTMRSSAGAGKPVEVIKTVNGRMTEAQSAIALMNLEDFQRNRQNNKYLHENYESRLSQIPGLRLVTPSGASVLNYQNVVIQVAQAAYGLSSDQLAALLTAENFAARRCLHHGMQGRVPFRQEKILRDEASGSTSCIQLPVGALVTRESAEAGCDFLVRAHHASSAIRAQYKSLAAE